MNYYNSTIQSNMDHINNIYKITPSDMYNQIIIIIGIIIYSGLGYFNINIPRNRYQLRIFHTCMLFFGIVNLFIFMIKLNKVIVLILVDLIKLIL